MPLLLASGLVQAAAAAGIYTEQQAAQQSPEIYQPNGGNELYVFELPR